MRIVHCFTSFGANITVVGCEVGRASASFMHGSGKDADYGKTDKKGFKQRVGDDPVEATLETASVPATSGAYS